ncbi:MAG: hypothetical protein GXP13_09455 [Gammaproteobacteria bacterium]|nr:hypothetical protein [Gammaproteobacteria bacterium]
MTIKTIEVGAFGCQHENWIDTYYPEDLPEDWRLDYYSHHFNIILMPENEWLNVTEEEISQWLADVKEGFEFLFAINDSDINEATIGQLGLIRQLLKPYFAGVVIKSPHGNLNDNDMQSLKAIAPVFVDGINPSGKQYPVCWRKGRDDENATIGFINETEAGNLREVRACVEAFMAQNNDAKKACLIFDGDTPSAKTIQDTQVIIEMLT